MAGIGELLVQQKEEVVRGVLVLFLALCSWWDLKEGRIPLRLFLVFLPIVFWGGLGQQTGLSWWLGLFPGLFLLGCGYFFPERIGAADGLMLLELGVGIGLGMTLLIFYLASILLTVAAVIRSRRKKREAWPFAPFLLAAFVICCVISSVA